MNMKTETAPATARAEHPAIADAIELLTQSAKDLADCLSFNGKKPNWKHESEAKVAYDKDLSTAAALRTAQAEIEAPLLARLGLVGECSAIMGSIGTELGEENAKLRQRIKALEGSARTSAEQVIGLRALNDEILGVLQELQESASYWSDYDVPLGIADRINSVIAKVAQPTIIHLPADDTEGGGL